MSSRPSRTTRSSTTAAAAAPPAGPAAVTRTRRTTASSLSTSTTTTADPGPARRTTRASKANPSSISSAAPPHVQVTQTRASLARGAANATSTSTSTRPLWTSNRVNVVTPPPTATPAAAHKRGTSLAIPGSTLRPKTPGSGLLARMTSRESLRQPKTPAQPVVRASVAPQADHTVESYDGTREPIKAFLRIRPAPPGVPLQSYLQVLNDTDVLMVPPMDHRLNPSSSSSSLFSNALLRSSNLHLNPASHPSGIPGDVLASPTPHSSSSSSLLGPDPSTYGSLFKFTSVFPPTSLSSSVTPTAPIDNDNEDDDDRGPSQAAFFRSTTLPLVRDFLDKGENCLLFAYGPTGSGKTWTVQGGQGEDAGLLPRVVNVVWKSLAAKRKPAGQVTPPRSRAPSRMGPPMTSTPTGSGSPRESLSTVIGQDSEVVPLSDGFEYAVWVSYSEIYNEKIYDLLEPPVPTSTTSAATPGGGGASHASNGGGGGGMFKGLFRNLTTVKRSALSLKVDKSAPLATGPGASQQKVVGGLREVKVASAEEAHAVLARGQSNRRVFSTLANRASSRSHGIFTIKLVRSSPLTGGEVSTSRFSIVDLAGSERVVNTQTTGDRLKEAGNINKSLMVLGQCMEVLRKNQEREKGRKPAIVPFRHSKLTEMFQSFFVGDGKAVMIVNINPYETGFDENAHVMKFSAVAKSVMTLKRGPDNMVDVAAPATVTLPASVLDDVQQKKEATKKKDPRVVRLSLVEGGEEQEVLYEEESDVDDEDEEDEFVGALLDELSALRTALLEAQMNTVLAVSTMRSQLVKEYEAKMLAMDREHQRRLREEAAEADIKFNAKLDILARLQAARTPARARASTRRHASLTPSTAYDDSDEDDHDENEEEEEYEEEEAGEDEEDDSEEVRGMLLPEADASLVESTASVSPLAARVQHVSLLSPPANTPASRTLGRSPLGTESPLLTRSELEQEEEEEEEEGLAEGDEVDVEKELPSTEVDEQVLNGGSDADYELSPAGSVARVLPSGVDKENEAPSPSDHVLGSDDDNDDEDGNREGDGFGFDRSMVIRSGSKVKKVKRKLGAKVRDVDDLDTLQEVLSPIRQTPSAGRTTVLQRA